MMKHVSEHRYLTLPHASGFDDFDGFPRNMCCYEKLDFCTFWLDSNSQCEFVLPRQRATPKEKIRHMNCLNCSLTSLFCNILISKKNTRKCFSRLFMLFLVLSKGSPQGEDGSHQPGLPSLTGIPSLKLTFSPLKMDAWKTFSFPFGFRPIFRSFCC